MPHPLITEFVADNQTGRVDEDGVRGDWIEIYNPDASNANMSGWALTDNAAIPMKWIFPAVRSCARTVSAFGRQEKSSSAGRATAHEFLAECQWGILRRWSDRTVPWPRILERSMPRSGSGLSSVL